MDGAELQSIGGVAATENEGQIEIGATLAPSITFASHQNDIAALTDLVIRNATDE